MPSKAVKKNPIAERRAKKRLSLFITGGLILALLAAGAVIAYNQVFKSQESRSQAAGGTDPCSGNRTGLVNLDSGCGTGANCKANERLQVQCDNGRTLSSGCRKDAACPAFCRTGIAIPNGACGSDGCAATARPVYICRDDNMKVKSLCRTDVACSGTTRPAVTTPTTTGTTTAPTQPVANPQPTVVNTNSTAFGCRVFPTQADTPIPNTYDFAEITSPVKAGDRVRFRCQPNQPAIRTFMGAYLMKAASNGTRALEYQASYGAIEQSGQYQYTAPMTVESGMKIECLPYSQTLGYSKDKCSYQVR